MMGTVIEKKEFDQIFNSDSTGKLKFAEMGIGWKDATNGNIITIQSSDMLSCSWFRAARSYAISIKKKDESSVSFDGFSRDYLVQLQSIFLSFYNIHIALKEMAIKGWNWGSTEFTGSNLEFLVGIQS